MKNYLGDNLKCGFTSAITQGKLCPRHILCLEIVTNECVALIYVLQIDR